MAARNTRRSTTNEPKAEATQAEPEAQVEETSQEVPTAEAVPTVEELMAQVAQLKQQLEAKPVRRQREVKPTPKQFRFLRALIADPTKSVPELCTEAGATETSHGFVFRMLEHGFLRVSVPEDVIGTYGLAGTEESTEGSEETEGAEADAS